MEPTQSHAAEKLIGVLREVIQHLDGAQPSDWTSGTPEVVVKALQMEIAALETTGKPRDPFVLSIHFAPTADLQEIAMANGWSDAYLKLSGEFDARIRDFL